MPALSHRHGLAPGDAVTQDDAGVESPFVLSLSPLRRRLETIFGGFLLALRPDWLARFRSGRGARTRLERVALRALVERYRRSGQLDGLAALHRDFWAGPAALRYHEQTRDRFDRVFLERHHAILAPLRRTAAAVDARSLCEIGCGSGQVLDHLATQLPRLTCLTGIDLNAEQVARNRRRPADPRIAYQCADATDWAAANPAPGRIWFCCGGVLEFFTAVRLAELFDHCGRNAPAVFALVEPLADDFDPDGDEPSRRFGRELTLSHPYPRMLASAGFTEVWRSESRAMGYRWLMLVAHR